MQLVKKDTLTISAICISIFTGTALVLQERILEGMIFLMMGSFLIVVRGKIGGA